MLLPLGIFSRYKNINKNINNNNKNSINDNNIINKKCCEMPPTTGILPLTWQLLWRYIRLY